MTNDSQDSEFQKYESLRDAGTSAKDTYLQAKADDLTTIECIRMLQFVFSLSLVETKDVMVVGDGLGTSLDDYEEKVITGLHNIVKLEEEDEDTPPESE
jgi:hypothetical protein